MTARTFADAWESFADGPLADAGLAVLDDARHVFYAGGFAMLVCVSEAMRERDGAWDWDAINDLRDEIVSLAASAAGKPRGMQ